MQDYIARGCAATDLPLTLTDVPLRAHRQINVARVQRRARGVRVKPYRYFTNCVNSTERAINDMRAVATDVSYEQFAHQCHGLPEWAEQMGYSKNPGKSGNLTLRKDFHVSYHRSKYKGRTCYYLIHSAIEYIWTLGGE